MILRALGLASCLLLSTSLFAAENRHVYPKSDSKTTEQVKPEDLKWPGYCEIEVINDSFTHLRVYGFFDDGVMMRPFTIYRYEYPHYISLFYYGYCHSGMDIYIDTLSGYHLYAGYTSVNTTIHVIPYMGAEAKAKVEVKAK